VLSFYSRAEIFAVISLVFQKQKAAQKFDRKSKSNYTIITM